MTTTTQDPPVEGEVLELDASMALEAQAKGEIDIQISTAKRYPRSIKQFLTDAAEMACLDAEVAASCGYAVPRKEDGKTKLIKGPSVRLAEICASAWGHIRYDARVMSIDEKFVVAKGVAWDLQRNVAAAFEVRRRITTKDGRRYSDDMIGTTANAAGSIALRNAVFKVIPKPFWGQIYDRAMKVAAGDAKTIEQSRLDVLNAFHALHVEPPQVFALLGIKGVQDLTLEHIAELKGLLTAIKDGDTTVDEAFADAKTNGHITPPQRKSQQAPVDAAPATPAASEVPVEPNGGEQSATEAPASVTPVTPAGVLITSVTVTEPKKKGDTRSVVAKADDGKSYFSDEPGVVAAIVTAKDKGYRMDITAPKRDNAGHFIIEELVRVQSEAAAQ